MKSYKVLENFAIVRDKKMFFEVGQVIPDDFFKYFTYPSEQLNRLIAGKKIELVKKDRLIAGKKIELVKKEGIKNEKNINN